MTDKPSPAQRRVLRNLIRGLPAGSHISGMAASGGFNGTVYAMTRRGWITWDLELTEAGRALARELFPLTAQVAENTKGEGP